MFGPTDEITAVFYLIAVICFALAAFAALDIAWPANATVPALVSSQRLA